MIACKNKLEIGGILNTIGNTPLVELKHLGQDFGFSLYAKLEFFNPSGSLKDRAALNIIETAIAEGKINSGTTIIECSSGNFGLALAMICKYLNLKFMCIVDPRVTTKNIELLEIYGAGIVLIEEVDVETGEFLPALIKKTKLLLNQIPNSFWPNQHGNLYNSGAHFRTMAEIIKQLNGIPDYIFCAISSCGTLRGCYDYISANRFPTKIYAIDAEGSKIFSNAQVKRVIPGHGAGLVPELYHQDIACTPVVVSARNAIKGCELLFDKEAIFVGGSSGAIISALYEVKDQVEEGKSCVVILCDRGDRYMDTLYSSEWIKASIL